MNLHNKINNGRYIIYSKHSGLSLDVAGKSESDGANVIQWTYLDGENQQFDITHIEGDYYSIRAVHTGKSLDVYERSQDPGGEIRQWDYWGGDNQLWKLVIDEDGYYTIHSKDSGLVLDVYNGSKENGGDIRQWTPNGNANQKWSLISVFNESLTDSGHTEIPLSQIALTAGPFKHAQDVNIDYLLNLDPDRLLMPYRREAGIATTAASYPNWESDGLDGHIGGHYLTALSVMYASTGNPEMINRLDYMIDALEAVQNAHGDGYIGGIPNGKQHWNDLANGTIQVGGFALNTMWVPWYNLHKVFAGLRDAYLYTRNSKALSLLTGLSDWTINITASLSDQQMQTMLICEPGGMNEVLADVYALTGDSRYLMAAQRFSHMSILNPLLEQTDNLTGTHANTQIPKVIGYERIGQLALDPSWIDAARFFWKTVVEERSISLGGNSVAEHFHDKSNFQSMVTSVEGPENCNTYNMLKLSKSLYRYQGDVKYIDYYERALYNHILSSQHTGHGGLVYFTPMRPDHFRIYSKHDECMWCCVGSGIENHGKYNEMIYAQNGDDFYVNLFIASVVAWKNGIHFKQETNFPESDTSIITVHGSGTFALNIRYPGWVQPGSMTVAINDQDFLLTEQPGQYISIFRSWSSGDTIRVKVPMRTVAEQLPDGLNYYSVLHGPIVLGAATNPYPEETLDFVADSARRAHVASNGVLAKLNESPILLGYDEDFLAGITPVSGQPMTFNVDPSVCSKDTPLTLVPFYKIHDSRYTVYFAHYTPEEWVVIEDELKAQAEAEAALEAITLDKVQPGQQQPESDHFIEHQNSNTGIHLNRYWRDATGFFSYLLNPQGESNISLRITYYGEDSGRTFDIYVDDQFLATQELTGGKGSVFFDVDYPIPASLNPDASSFRVRFQARNGSIAGGVFYVRLISNT